MAPLCPFVRALSWLGIGGKKAGSSTDLGMVVPGCGWGRRMKEKNSGVSWEQSYPGSGRKTLFNGCIRLHDIKCFMLESYRTFLTEFYPYFRQGESRVQEVE